MGVQPLSVMTENNPFQGLPEEVTDRARNLHDSGLSPKRAIALAAKDLEYGADWDLEDIAEVLDVNEKTIYSNASKANTEVEKAARLLIQSAGGTRIILSEYEPHPSHYPFERYYITAFFHENDGYDDASIGEAGVTLFILRGGASGGHPSRDLSISSEDYASLDELADNKYRNEEFGSYEDAEKWHTLLTDAGIAEQDLEKPGKKLPASHPDSADHFQYQMQSLEGPEDRRPPRR